MDDAEAAERNQTLKNPFPKPPTHWTLYTNENLRLLELLKQRLQEKQSEKDITDATLQVDQVPLLHDEPSLPSFSLLELEPPRLDWIYEKGEYTTFGESRPTTDQTTPYPSDIKQFAELGGQADPRPLLRNFLLSMLQTYHKLLGVLLEPLPVGYYHGDPSPAPNWEFPMTWLEGLSMNFMFTINELRPVQARLTLESMMRRQINIRRSETKAIHEKCNALEKSLQELRTRAGVITSRVDDLNQKEDSIMESPTSVKSLPVEPGIPLQKQSLVDGFIAVSDSDLLNWSNEV